MFSCLALWRFLETYCGIAMEWLLFTWLLIAGLFLTGKCGGVCAGFPSRNPQWVALSHLLRASTEHREPISGAAGLRVTPEVTWSDTF